MAKQSFIPGPDGAFLIWLLNLANQVLALMGVFNLTQSQVDAMAADHLLMQGKNNTLNAKKSEYSAASTDHRTTRTAVTKRVRALIRQLKAHGNYTTAHGELLGAVGPEDTTDPDTAKPVLTVEANQNGNVVIGFVKSIFTGIRLETKRGNETVYIFLAIDTESPYTDSRLNLVAGPETRQYRAQYLLGDDLVGEVSDILTVTVPG